jgi:hypothetical protein
MLHPSKAKTKSITNLIIDNDTSITHPNEILLEEQKCYKQLYKDEIDYQDNQATEARKYFLTKPIQKVNDADHAELEMDITDNEIANALLKRITITYKSRWGRLPHRLL